MFQPASLVNLAATSTFSNAEWRWAIFPIGIGAILLIIGFMAVGIFLFRKQTTDRTLLYFGIYVILYAARTLLRVPPLLSVFSVSPAIAGHLIRAITCMPRSQYRQQSYRSGQLDSSYLYSYLFSGPPAAFLENSASWP
jgi:hypothetical protein